MPINQLNHVNIRTDKLEETRRFYEEAVGLYAGPRPQFSTPGYWMYCGDAPLVHLSEVETNPVPRTNPDGMGRGLDHIAFMATDLDGFTANLKWLGIDYRQRTVAGGGVIQVFFDDPNGVTVEIGFPVTAAGDARRAAATVA
ncbi:MAG: glyoxalase [Alphaproteobacteria bacterium]|nr:glyoxalase [Alphaproteobacteria bacterium]